MSPSNQNSPRLIGVLSYYIFGLILCVFTMYFVLQLWQFNLFIPYVYNGDGLSSGLLIKGMIENGWYNINPLVGVPGGLEMYDYPIIDSLHFFIMKIISFINSDYAFVMNMYYLLTYPLVMLTTMIVFIELKINPLLALLGALLYTFLPYHIFRGGHLFLIGYYLVPLAILIVIWIATQERLFFSQNLGKKLTWSINKKSIAALVICILVSCNGAYYAFFTCFFLIIIGIYTSLSSKKILPLLISSVLIATVTLGVAVNILPSFVHKYKNAGNPIVSARNFEATETYGLKITQMLLPITNHRIDWVAAQKEKYNRNAPLVNENDTAALGVLGGIGFIVLLFSSLFLQRFNGTIVASLGVLNLSAILLGTIGGFGTVFAILVTAQIRSYNRLSIFIAFLSFAFLMILASSIYERYGHRRVAKYALRFSVVVCAIFGIYDQTSPSLVPSSIIEKEYYSDGAFIAKIEEVVPKDAMIFQLPYVSFPEGEHIQNLGNYDLLKGYLHSDSLKWSFGGMKNREGDVRFRELVKKEINVAMEMISAIGFQGIYIDRNGYSKEYLNNLENELLKMVKISPIESNDKRLVFYDMKEFNSELKMKRSPEELEDIREQYVSLSIGKRFVLDGTLGWQFAWDSKGFKVLQFEVTQNMQKDQFQFKVVKKGGEPVNFNDSFRSADSFSYRHWESPRHFVLSISDNDTGWGENYTPSVEEIKSFFDTNPYELYYKEEGMAKGPAISFNEKYQK